LTSSYSPRQSPVSTRARLMTMSISAAPAATEASICSIFRGSGICPAGNPVDTAATGMPVPASSATASSTKLW
jgi:hypothetical protein